MKHLFLSVLLLPLILVPAGAVDFGLVTESETSLSYEGSADFSHELTESLWFRTDLPAGLSLDMEGSYSLFNYFDEGGPHFDDHSLQLDSLSLDGSWTPFGLLSVSAGRFLFTDYSGKVLMQTMDGLALGWSYGIFSVNVSGGYSGLLPVNSTSFLMTQSDLTALSEERTLLPARAPARIVSVVTVGLSEILLRQNLSLCYVIHEDLRDDSALDDGYGRADVMYVGGGWNGPLAGPLFWNGWGYTASGTLDEETLGAWVFGGGFDLYLSSFLSTTISLSGVASSGDADYSTFYEGNEEDDAAMFVAITASAPAVVFAPQLGNLAYGKLLVSMKPLSGTDTLLGKNLSLQLSGLPFFRLTKGPVSDSDFSTDSSEYYLGTEADLSLRLRLTSDLGISLSGGIFFPGNGFSDTAWQAGGSLGISLGL